jgi:hypothetical protein
MLFISTCIFYDKLRPQILSIGTTANATLNRTCKKKKLFFNVLLLLLLLQKTDITPQIIFFDGEEAYQQWTETDSLYGARHLADRWQRTLSPHISDKNELQTIVSGLGRNLI